MILPKRPEQTEAEYARELDDILSSLQVMTRTDGWARFAGQLALEMNAAWKRMADADTADKKAMAATEYMVLKRMLDAPGMVMNIASQALKEKPQAAGRK